MVKIVTSNEQNKLTSTERQADVAKIYDYFAPSEPIVLWQEVKGYDRHQDVIAQEPAGTQHVFGPSTELPDGLPIPISVPSRFIVVEQGWTQTKENTAEFYDDGSAERFYAWVRLHDTHHETRPDFFVINTHFTNGCDWDDSNSNDDAQNAFLRPYWNTHWDLMKAEIDRIKDNDPGGLDSTCFYGGDFNRKDSPPFGSAEKLAVGDGRIDKLAVIDRSLDTTLKNTGTITTISDHNAHWAKWDVAIRP